MTVESLRMRATYEMPLVIIILLICYGVVNNNGVGLQKMQKESSTRQVNERIGSSCSDQRYSL